MTPPFDPIPVDATGPLGGNETSGLTELVALLDNTSAYYREGSGITRKSIAQAEAILASDWLAARDTQTEAKVRAEVSDELTAMAVAGRALYPTHFQQGIERGMENAARIARGGTQ